VNVIVTACDLRIIGTSSAFDMSDGRKETFVRFKV
jgi:hypothetical protein